MSEAATNSRVRPSRTAVAGERAIIHWLLPALLAENRGNDTLIACQRDICGREGRIDVVAVNGALSGFEVKSGRDSLDRLPRQADLYSRVLDYATLVCDERHLSAAEQIVPPWWGIRQARTVDGAVKIDRVREPNLNEWVRPHDLARMLHFDELYDELARVRGLRRISALRRAEMAWLLVEATDEWELRRLVKTRLRQRPSWRAAALRR